MADIVSATNNSRTQGEAPSGAFFLFVSKGFGGAIRLSETGRRSEISLRTHRVSFHPPFIQIESTQKWLDFQGLGEIELRRS